MSLTQAMPNSAQEVSVNPLTEAEYNELYNLLQTLIDHINSNGMSLASEPSDGSGKLVKLSIRHLMELASDMCDELERRATGSLSPLPSKSELSDKRNNARMRMAAFPFSKLNGLILDVAQELDKRNLFAPSQDQSTNLTNTTKKATVTLDSFKIHESSPSSNKKNKIEQIEEKNQPGSFSPMKRKSFGGGMCSGIDSLDAMIEDLGSLIEGDNNEEIDELKRKYEAEIQNLKQVITKYETTVILEKNREIAKLMTKIEETELINSRLRKELSLLNQQLSCKDSMLQDQKAAYSSLKAALESIENQISNRDSNTLSSNRNSARIELVSNNVFSDLKLLSDQMFSSIGEIEVCISNFNQKLFLKLLRDFGTSAKFYVMLFDKIIQVSASLNIDNLCENGEKCKSEYISALSSILVCGKDFSARPEFCSDIISAINDFKSSLESLDSLKLQFETELKN